MGICARPGCENEARRTYCSTRCSAKVVAQRRPPGYFAALGQRALAVKRAQGRLFALRPHEMRLITQGRYREAGQAIYDRGYSAGYVARTNSRHQLPMRTGAA